MKSQFLDDNQAAVVHEATLQVLERTGIALHHPEAEELLLCAGARKEESGRILIPRALVQTALERAPQSFTLYRRDGEPGLELKNGPTYFGPGSDALKQVDLKTGEVRDSVLADVERNTRIADALGCDFIMSQALPRDLPAHALYPGVFAAMARNTPLPLVVTGVTLADFEHMHALAALAVGGREQLERRPFFLTYVEPLSPLIFDQNCVDKLLFCARNRIPFVFAAGANCGTGAPIYPEGGVVQGGAESLAGLVIAMLVTQDVRFVYGANTSSADMRSGMVCYGAPEWSKTVAMYADMARSYDLPVWGTAGCTDSVALDAQAGWEAARGVLLALQSGSTLVHDMGYMNFGELWDPRMLALAMEVVREARHLLKPADLSAEALSGAVIDEVARGGSLYLGHKATARGFRKSLFISKLINRQKLSAGPLEIGPRVGEQLDKLLGRHKPELLDEQTVARMQAYLQAIPTS